MPKVVVRKGYRCLPGKRRELLAALQRVDAVAAEAGWPRGRYLFVETKASGEPDVEVEFTFESYGEMEQLERRLREHLSRSPRDAASIGSAGQEFLLEPSSTRYLLLLDDGAAAAQPRRIAETRPQSTPPPAPAAPQVSTANPPSPPGPTPSHPAMQRRPSAAGYTGSGGGAGEAGGAEGVVSSPSAPRGSAADRIRPATPTASPPAAPAGRAGPPEPEPPPEGPPDEEAFFAEPDPEPEPLLSPAERRLRARAALDMAENTVNVSPEQRARARQITQRNPDQE